VPKARTAFTTRSLLRKGSEFAARWRRIRAAALRELHSYGRQLRRKSRQSALPALHILETEKEG
jgi:hypothetical protein